MGSTNWPVLGGVAAAVLAGIYALWGPGGHTQSRRKRETCPGLTNLGNTCFLNSILQSWATCEALIQWLGDFIDRRITDHYSQYLAFTILRTIKVLNNESVESTDPHNPVDVIEALRERRWYISSDEQDAHELFHIFTESLAEEISKYPRVVSLLDMKTLDSTTSNFQPSSAACAKYQARLPLLPSREENAHPFKGSLASHLQCRKCGHKCPVRYDSFDSISLSIPSRKMGPIFSIHCALTLDQLLRHYISTETVQNVSCEHCSKIKSDQKETPTADHPLTPFSKRLTIGKLPPCLCIHIQRTVWLDDGMPMKRFDHVKFPEILSMDAYVHHKRSKTNGLDIGGQLFGGKSPPRSRVQASLLKPANSIAIADQAEQGLNNTNSHPQLNIFLPPSLEMFGQALRPSSSSSDTSKQGQVTKSLSSQERLYRLVSVVSHLGNVFSGHFVCYRRAPSSKKGECSNKWLCTSDESVTVVDFDEVLACSAYMLFYEKL